MQVDKNSKAEKAGIVEGLIVKNINAKSTDNLNLKDINDEIENASHPITLLLFKNNEAEINQISSQRSSKNLSTDESSHSTDSESTVINLNSTNYQNKSDLRKIKITKYINAEKSSSEPLHLYYNPKSNLQLITGNNNSNNKMSVVVENYALDSNSPVNHENNTFHHDSNAEINSDILIKSNPDKKNLKDYDKVYLANTARVTKSENNSIITNRNISKTVTYSSDITKNNTQRNIRLGKANFLQTNANMNGENPVNEIHSNYWPVGTVITVEQQMELERKQKEESESIYSKVNKEKTLDIINKNLKLELQPFLKANQSINKDYLNNLIHDDKKLCSDIPMKIGNHDLAQVSSDITYDVTKFEVESALNNDGKRRSRSVPLSDVNSQTKNQSTVQLKRKSSSVDRKIRNQTSFGRSFLFKLFGNQKKHKESKLDCLDKLQNSSYETIANVEMKINTEKNEIIKHAETYVVVERSKKINKTQFRNSMISMDDSSTSCMPACICLGIKSKNNRTHNSVEKSPEYKKSSELNDKPKEIESANCEIPSENFVAEQKTHNQLNIQNLESELSPSFKNNHSKGFLENAITDQFSDKQFHNNFNLKNDIMNESSTIDDLSHTNENKFALNLTNDVQYSDIIVEKAIIEKIDDQNLKSNHISSNEGKSNITRKDEIQLETNKLDIVNKELHTDSDIVDVAMPVVLSIPISIHNINDNLSKSEISSKFIYLEPKDFETQSNNFKLSELHISNSSNKYEKHKLLNIYDDSDISSNATQINSKDKIKLKDNDYDIIEVKDNNINSKNFIMNDYQTGYHTPLSSYTLPNLKMYNQPVTIENNKVSTSNSREIAHYLSPIYDVPSINNNDHLSQSTLPTFNINMPNHVSNNYVLNNCNMHENINKYDFCHIVDETSTYNGISSMKEFSKFNLYEKNYDNISSIPPENIYEKIQLTPEINKKDNFIESVENEILKLENNHLNPTVKPLKNLNDLVLPVYTRISHPNISHQVVKPEPIKPNHLNLTKINYICSEKKESPKKVDDILNEILPTKIHSSNLLSNQSNYLINNNSNIDLNIEDNNIESSFEKFDSHNDILKSKLNNIESFPEIYNNLNKQAISNNLSNKECNSQQFVRNTIETKLDVKNQENYNILQINSQKINDYQNIDKFHSKSSHNCYQNIKDVNSIKMKTDFNTENVDELDNKKHKYTGLDIYDNYAKDSNHNSQTMMYKENQYNTNFGNSQNHNTVKSELNELHRDFKSLKSYGPKIIVTENSPQSTLDAKFHQNTTMVEKQKRKLEIERILAVERQRKIAKQFRENQSRRHSDNYSPLEKASIILKRYEKDYCKDKEIIVPEKMSLTIYKGKARVLYNFRAQRPR